MFSIAYNKEIFDEARVPYPTNDWTWDDFAEIAKLVSSGSGADQHTLLFHIGYLIVLHLICMVEHLIMKIGLHKLLILQKQLRH